MSENEGKHGVQSLEIGMQVLRAIVEGNRGMALKDVAAAAGMPASKAHRYLVSLIRTGLVEQDPASSRYDLGAFALTMGLVAGDRLDRINQGLAVVSRLCSEVNEATALVTWSQNGPIVVRWERPRKPITISVHTGSALSMLNTASGRIFGAYLPQDSYEHLLKAELKSRVLPDELRSRPMVETLFEDVRRASMSIVEGQHLAPGVAAMAVPVFDARGQITLSVAAMGIRGMIDTRPDGAVAVALKAAGEELSQRLGHRQSATDQE